MKFKFNNYFDFREYFNKYKHRLNKGDLNKFRYEVQNRLEIQENTEYLNEFKNLIEDIEEEIDLKSRVFVLVKRTEPVTKDTSLLIPSGDISINIKSFDGGDFLHKLEKEAIRLALLAFDGNREKTCKFLGLSVRTLRNKINEYLDSDQVNNAHE